MPICRSLSLVACLVSFGAVPSAYAMGGLPGQLVFCTNCSTLETQASQLAKEVQTALTNASQLQTQIQQYENMITQGLTLPTTEYSQITDDLQQLQSVYEQGQSLSGQLQNFTTDFQKQFPSFNTFLKKAGGDPAAMSTYYKDWSANTTAAAQQAMKAAGMNINQIPGETSQLNTLVQQSQTAAGRMQAIQAGNQIAAMQVQQLQKMRTMLNDQIQAGSSWYAQQAETAAAKMAADQQADSGTVVDSPAKGY